MNEASEKALFDLDCVFDVDDYMFVYQENLTDERSDSEIALWTKLLEMDSPQKVLFGSEVAHLFMKAGDGLSHE